jgi:hypothetical protein
VDSGENRQRHHKIRSPSTSPGNCCRRSETVDTERSDPKCTKKKAHARCSESRPSVDCRPTTCKSRRKQHNLSVQTNISHRRLCSDSQIPKRRQLAHGARNRAGQLIAVQRPAKRKAIGKTNDEKKPSPRRRLCSNSQTQKQRKLAHSARNRAHQLVAAQGPAKSTKTHQSLFRSTQTHDPSAPLFQLTAPEAKIAGTQCSESAPSVD